MDQWIKQLLNGEIFWHDYEETTPAPPAAVRPSAFLPYPNIPRARIEPEVMISSPNVNKRAIEFLRKSWPTTTTETRDSERERCFRHMMNERMRREKQKKSYFALYSMLPHGTKNDKNSIVQTATNRVQELVWLKNDLQKRNNELQANLAAMNEDKNDEGSKIRVRIDHPTSGIDSMLEVLNCLKRMNSNPRMIRSKFTTQEFLAVMDIETQIGAAEVEKVVNRTVQEAERMKTSGTLDRVYYDNYND